MKLKRLNIKSHRNSKSFPKENTQALIQDSKKQKVQNIRKSGHTLKKLTIKKTTLMNNLLRKKSNMLQGIRNLRSLLIAKLANKQKKILKSKILFLKSITKMPLQNHHKFQPKRYTKTTTKQKCRM